MPAGATAAAAAVYVRLVEFWNVNIIERYLDDELKCESSALPYCRTRTIDSFWDEGRHHCDCLYSSSTS